jgi:hypothetical protein
MRLAPADRPPRGSARSVPQDTIRFCSRCGARHERHEVDDGAERVCPGCGMGVLLWCPREALMSERAAFLIATDDMRISAVSTAAERLVGPERWLLGSTLQWAMSSPLGDDALALRVARAAAGERDVVLLPVELVRTRRPVFGRLEARVSCCWPPRGALVVLEKLASRLR